MSEKNENNCPQCHYNKPAEQTTEECPQCHYERPAVLGEDADAECPQCHYKGKTGKDDDTKKKGNPQGFYGNK